MRAFLAWLRAKPIRSGLFLGLCYYVTVSTVQALTGEWGGWAKELPYALFIAVFWVASARLQRRFIS